MDHSCVEWWNTKEERRKREKVELTINLDRVL